MNRRSGRRWCSPPEQEADQERYLVTGGAGFIGSHLSEDGRKVFLAYREEKGLGLVAARFFNTVGPRQTGRYGMVVPNFVKRALAGETLTVHGDGEQSRSFTHVNDAVWAASRLMELPESEEIPAGIPAPAAMRAGG